MINIRNTKRYCSDYRKIENYEKAIDDTTKVWQCHHRLETHFSDGTERPKDAQISMNELKAKICPEGFVPGRPLNKPKK